MREKKNVKTRKNEISCLVLALNEHSVKNRLSIPITVFKCFHGDCIKFYHSFITILILKPQKHLIETFKSRIKR